MNHAMILYVLGWVASLEAVLLIPAVITGLIFGESVKALLTTIAICLVIGLPITRFKPKSYVIFAREGFVTVALSWLVLSMLGAMPFYLSGYIPSYIDAVFETVSGFTTTGASILTDVEALPNSLLFWRSFTHWIGGMGVLVFLLMILPLAGGYRMNLMKAESPGPSVDKLVPKVRETAMTLYLLYMAITFLECVALLLSGMPLFDSLCMTFGTAGTGGFGIRNDSAGSYTAVQQWILTIFMILFGVNFNAYWLLTRKEWKNAFASEEVRTYFGIILVSVLVLFLSIGNMYGSYGNGLRHSAFTVATIITTTGFSSVDFDVWPEIARNWIVILMFIGACAGSTGGGIKVSRILLFLKTGIRELHLFIHPHSVKQITMDKKPVNKNTVRTVCAFMAAYLSILIVSVLIVSLEGYDGVTTFTSVAATLNNIGPGLNLVGPSANYSFFGPLTKIVLIFDMLAGRLELFPILLLFYPGTWKKY